MDEVTEICAIAELPNSGKNLACMLDSKADGSSVSHHLL
jgi:hypothetical protein